MRPQLPEALDRVIVTAMAKQPGDRYQSCADLAGAAVAAMSATGGAASFVPPGPPSPVAVIPPARQQDTRSTARIVSWILAMAVVAVIIAVVAWAPWNHRPTTTSTPPTSANAPSDLSSTTTQAVSSAATSTSTSTSTSTAVDVPGLTPFVGSWHAHASGLEIEPSGSGSLTYADLSACPTACSYGSAPAATVRFILTSVSNGGAAGTVIASTDIENDKVGEQVLIDLESVPGTGSVLHVNMGKMKDFPFCTPASTNYCGS